MGKLKELLLAEGFNETDYEKIKNCVSESGYLPDGAIPKARLDEMIAQRENLKEQISSYEKQINDLKKSAGDNEELKKQLEQAKEEAKRIAKDGETKLRAIIKRGAVKADIANKVYDAEIVCNLLNMDEITYDEANNRIVGGLEEQLNPLKEKKGFLFITNTPTPAGGGYVPPQGNPTPPPKPEEKSEAVLRAERLAHKSNQ